MTTPAAPPGRPFSCPLCGRRLRFLDGADDVSPPYLCDDDRRSWWGSELTADALAAFDPVTVSWRPGLVRADVLAGIRDEVEVRRAKRGQS